MRSIPTWFFATAGIFALCGMAWGIQMSATQDHSLAPAHGHLNLIGFVALSVFGAYYALSPSAAASRMARLHYVLATAAVVVITPGIVLALTGAGEILAKIGSVLALASMAMFVWMVVRHGTCREPTAEDRRTAVPAE